MQTRPIYPLRQIGLDLLARRGHGKCTMQIADA